MKTLEFKENSYDCSATVKVDLLVSTTSLTCPKRTFCSNMYNAGSNSPTPTIDQESSSNRMQLIEIFKPGQFRFFLLLLVWMSFVSNSSCVAQSLPSLSDAPNIPASEMNALYDLYTATNGEDWLWNEDTSAYGIPWNFSDPSVNNPCEDYWQGLTCGFTTPFEYYHVTYLYLPSFNLVGTLPSTLAALTQLLYLDLGINQLTGTIPESVGNLSQMALLRFTSNHLFGNVPASLGDLSILQYLYLEKNHLSGTLPATLGYLPQLLYVYVHNNQFTGTIPESLSNLALLEVLFLDYNQLNGSIPHLLGNLSQLQYLGLSINQLTGSIPASLGNLTGLLDFKLEFNKLTGTIPESLGNLYMLQYLNFDNNQLTGTIPESLGNMIQLLELHLNTNQLSGSLPVSLVDLTQLEVINLGYNGITGTVPDALSHLTQLLELQLYSNKLVGTIPDSLGSLWQLLFFDFSSNHIHGTIPATLGNLTLLQDFSLYNNNLHGVIPASLGNLTQLQYLYLESNLLTSTIPDSIANLTKLQYLIISSNQLTGTIPESFGSLTHLKYFLLNTNHLSGTMPYFACESLEQLLLSDNRLHGGIPSLAHVTSLQVVLLHNNKLTSSLNNIFNPTAQQSVATIVLANNQLTGTIPEAIFRLNLSTFVATSNCFEGPLPIPVICNNPTMVSFVIDGMGSASTCRNKLFVGPLSAYSLEHAIGGSIPSCLFQLPNITTLHLSGNGFTGSIPGDIVLSHTLTDLALSHNLLTGSIPQQLQLKHWKNIDLSYNRLSGTLLTDFASNRTVAMENNRLSGSFPPSFFSMTNISVLGSNTFSCDYDESDLPEHDPNKEKYHCGSNSFDVLFYIWLGAIVCVVVVIFFIEKNYQIVRSIQSGDSMLHDSNLYISLNVVCRQSLTCACYSVVVLLPLYAACSTTYGTQTYAYAYQISAVYVSGAVPFAVDWCFWSVLVVLFAAILLYAPAVSLNGKDVMSEPTQRSIWQTVTTFVPYVVFDIVVVAGVNAAYVYVAVYKSSALLSVVQMLLAVFKVIWGRWALPYILTVLTQSSKHGEVHVFTQIVVNLLNNIVIPYLIVAVVSPNCFYDALVAAPVVSSTVYYTECVSLNPDTEACVAYENFYLPTSFNPPFTYNYQCSSSLVTYYSPAFVSMCIVSTFVTPLVQYMCQWLHRRAKQDTLWYRLLDSCLPRLMKPLVATTVLSGKGYINAGGLMTTLISTLGLILTFGVMFPPLCVAFTVSLCATVFYFRNNVGRIIQDPTQQENDNIMEITRAECNSVDAMHILKGSVWLLITVSCWFYTLFLFDTLGDAVGFEGAYWVLIVIPLMPLVLYAFYTAVLKYDILSQPSRDEDKQNHIHVPDVNIEMPFTSYHETDVHNVLIVGQPDSIIVNAVVESDHDKA